MVSLTRRTAGCGPACPVVWEGRTGNRLPYPDIAIVSEHVVDGSPRVLYNSVGAIRTIAFQEAPVITSIEIPRGWCAFHKLPSYC